MDSQKVDIFLMANNKFFPETQIPFIRERLLQADDSHAQMIQFMQFKDPMTSLLLGLIPAFVGICGIDRFYIGDTGIGIGKLLTCGGCGIWWLIDLFLIMNATKEKNLAKLTLAL